MTCMEKNSREEYPLLIPGRQHVLIVIMMQGMIIIQIFFLDTLYEQLEKRAAGYEKKEAHEK